MTHRILKDNVESRFRACVRMAERVGLNTDGWHIWSQYDRQWCALTESGSGIFGSGAVFANGNRQAYDVMEGWLKALQAVNDLNIIKATEASITGLPQKIVAKYNIVAAPAESTIEVRL